MVGICRCVMSGKCLRVMQLSRKSARFLHYISCEKIGWEKMEVNTVTIIVLIIIGLCVWRGCSRGLFQTVLVTGATILAIVLSNYATPYVSEGLQKYTNIDEKVEEYIITALELDAAQENVSRIEEIMAIDSLPIPDALKMAVINNNNSAVYSKWNITSFYEYIAHYLCCIVMNCLSFILIQLILTIIFLIFLYTSRKLTEIPILHGIDKAGGIILGLVQALAIIWSVFIFISLIGNTPLGMNAYAQISESKVLNLIYEHNWLLDTITNVTNMKIG